MKRAGESGQGPELDLAMEATRALGVFAGNIHAMSKTFEQGSEQIKGVQQACSMFRSALERYKAQKFSAARQVPAASR